MRSKNLRNPFRAAIPYLWTGANDIKKGRVNSEYICCAIELAREMGKCSFIAQQKAFKHIDFCLGGLSAVTSWLSVNHPQSKKDWSFSSIQTYRHRWLNHLADQWDKGEICP